jgi:hypothetical protein
VNDQIREQLIGYVLGALDEHEHQYVEQQLGSDPLWQCELEAVQKHLEPLVDAYREYQPPVDLGQRTRMFVAQESARLNVERPRRSQSTFDGSYEVAGRWRMADWVVVAGICMAAGALFFPALLNSRFSARMVSCQHNLREIGVALTRFSETSRDRLLPAAATDGNRAFAGFYACELQQAGFLPDSRLVICPDSPLARDANHFRIPKTSEIDAAVGEEILLMQRVAGGAYAYTLGYICNGQFFGPRNLNRPYFVLMADAPSLEFGRFAVHGKGLNVLYEDCHVRYVCDLQKDNDVLVDNPFCNRFGRIEAGTDIDDAVVAPSYHPPLLKNTSTVSRGQ